MPFRIHAQRKGIILHSKECSKLSHTELVELLVEFTFIAAVGDVDLKMCGRRVSTSLGQWIYCLLRGRSCRQVHREDLSLYHIGHHELRTFGGLCRTENLVIEHPRP